MAIALSMPTVYCDNSITPTQQKALTLLSILPEKIKENIVKLVMPYMKELINFCLIIPV